jgi:hypothetical protein
MLREIQAKGKAARFEKVDRGLFKKNLVGALFLGGKREVRAILPNP